MVGIIAEAIKHNVSLTVHEAKYIDLGWTGIAQQSNKNVNNNPWNLCRMAHILQSL